MKKVFLTFALVVFAFAVNAQIIVGGNLGIVTHNSTSVETTIQPTGTTTEETFNPKTFNFYIMPKIGFQIDDRMSAGLIFGYEMSNRRTVLTYPTDADPLMYNAAVSHTLTDYAGTNKWASTQISICPYFRYNLIEFNDLTLFAEAEVPVTIHPAEKTDIYEEGVYGGSRHTVETHILNNKRLTLGVMLIPGLNYAFNDHLSMDIYFNAISLGYAMIKTTTSIDNFDKNEEVTTEHDLGFNVRSLPDGVSFGINYAF